jgi:hypothetical protein
MTQGEINHGCNCQKGPPIDGFEAHDRASEKRSQIDRSGTDRETSQEHCAEDDCS